MATSPLHVARAADVPRRPARRAGFAEQRLLTADVSTTQNVVRVRVESGAAAEDHAIPTSESLFVLAGVFEVTSDGAATRLAVGDLCHFAAGSRHGLRSVDGPGELLVIWAPAAGPVTGPAARSGEGG